MHYANGLLQQLLCGTTELFSEWAIACTGLFREDLFTVLVLSAVQGNMRNPVVYARPLIYEEKISHCSDYLL